jgi:hypothetical protein
MPRPEGQRCLLIASGGQTVARMRSGVQMARFPSALPGGSRRTQARPGHLLFQGSHATTATCCRRSSIHAVGLMICKLLQPLFVHVQHAQRLRPLTSFCGCCRCQETPSASSMQSSIHRTRRTTSWT